MFHAKKFIKCSSDTYGLVFTVDNVHTRHIVPEKKKKYDVVSASYDRLHIVLYLLFDQCKNHTTATLGETKKSSLKIN